MLPRRYPVVVVVVLLALSCVIVGAKPQDKPKYVRLCLAGECLGLDESFSPSKYDSKSGYYLIAGGDCDAAHMFLLLTPDYNLVKQDGYSDNITHASLPRLHNQWCGFEERS